MTKNQIDFRRAQEEERHNKRQEEISWFKESEAAARAKAESLRREGQMVLSIANGITDNFVKASQYAKNIGSAVSSFSGIFG